MVDPALGRNLGVRRANNVVQGPAGREPTSSPSKRGCSSRRAPRRIGSESRSSSSPRSRRGRRAHGRSRGRRPAGGARLRTTCASTSAERARYRTLRDNYSLTFSPESSRQVLSFLEPPAFYYLQTRRATRASSARRTCCSIPQYWGGGLSGSMPRRKWPRSARTRLQLAAARAHRVFDASLRKRAPGAQRCRRGIPPTPVSAASQATGVAQGDRQHRCGLRSRSVAFAVPTPRICAFCMDRERESVHRGVERHLDHRDGHGNRAGTSGVCAEDRDALANVSALGAPVATARYMGGNGSTRKPSAQSGDRARRSMPP